MSEIADIKDRIRKLNRYSTNDRAILFPDDKGDFVEIGAVLSLVSNLTPTSNTSISGIAEEIRNEINHVTPEWWRAYQNQLQQIDEPDGIYVFIRIEDAVLFNNAPTWLRTLLEENNQLRKQNNNIIESWNEQKEEIRSLHAGYTSANAKRDEELYFWEPYAENHLETLTGGVVIRAEWMRQLIGEATQQLREELAEEKRHAALGWEQSNKWLEENGRLRAELDQVKKERDLLQLNLETQTRHFNNTTEELEKAYEECDAMESELAEKDKVLVQVIGILKQANVDAFDTGECVRLIESILSHYKKGDTKDV